MQPERLLAHARTHSVERGGGAEAILQIKGQNNADDAKLSPVASYYYYYYYYYYCCYYYY